MAQFKTLNWCMTLTFFLYVRCIRGALLLSLIHHKLC